MYGGYHQLQNPKQRYSLINRQKLTALLGIKDNDQLSEYHRNWVEEVLKKWIIIDDEGFSWRAIRSRRRFALDIPQAQMLEDLFNYFRIIDK